MACINILYIDMLFLLENATQKKKHCLKETTSLQKMQYFGWSCVVDFPSAVWKLLMKTILQDYILF